MALDVTTIHIGTRVKPDVDEHNSVIRDDNGNWKTAIYQVELMLNTDGAVVNSIEVPVTFNQYQVIREDFPHLTKQDIVDKYFPELTDQAEDTESQEPEATEDATPEDLTDPQVKE